MDLILIPLVLLFLVSIAFRMYYMRYRTRKMTAVIISAFLREGAISEQRARTLEDLKLTKRKWSTGLRDDRTETLKQMVRHGVVLSTADNRYYLSPEAYQQVAERQA